MGMTLSYPFVNKLEMMTMLESCDNPDVDEESDEMNIQTRLHEINLRYSSDVVKQRTRSSMERARFQKYHNDWSNVVMDLKEKFPHWTTEDLLNLRRQFEMFDTKGDNLLDFSEFTTALDLINERSSHQERREMFDTADVQNHKSINFEEFLHLMSRCKLGSGHAHPESDSEVATPTSELVAEVAFMDPYQQMSYGLF